MNIEFSKLPPVDRYRLMIQSIVPRPIAWTLTQNESGNLNLAPFSYFNAVHSNPPIIMMSVGNKRDKSVKDTRRNIEREKSFVVHIASAEHAPAVTLSAEPLAAGESEVEACGLETVSFEGFSLPRLATAKIAFGCHLERVIEVGQNKQGLIFGQIQCAYLADEIVSEVEGALHVDAMKLNPLGRLGGNDYGTLGKVVTVDRPDYKPH